MLMEAHDINKEAATKYLEVIATDKKNAEENKAAAKKNT